MRNQFAKSNAFQSNSICKMKIFLILLLVPLNLCDANNIHCVHVNEALASVEFYCKHFNGTLPENCKPLNTIEDYDKSKVIQLKIGGCGQNEFNDLLYDHRFIHSLDVSNSNLPRFPIFYIDQVNLRKMNVSHNNISYIDSTNLPKLVSFLKSPPQRLF